MTASAHQHSGNLAISGRVAIPLREVVLEATRSRGPGGQNVNKVATGVQLRFDVRASSLPEPLRERLLELDDHRITRDGVVVIRADRHRSRERNTQDALARLRELVQRALPAPKRRKPSRPSRAARQRRLDAKRRRGQTKRLRGRPPE